MGVSCWLWNLFFGRRIYEKAERYDQKYQEKSPTLNAYYTHHIWSEPKNEPHNLTLIPDELYRLAKLAGKPEEKAK